MLLRNHCFFCRVATIAFSSCCLMILIKKNYDFRWQLLSDGSDIAKKLKIISTLMQHLAMVLTTKMFASDGQR
jgi:hypothetical protein